MMRVGVPRRKSAVLATLRHAEITKEIGIIPLQLVVEFSPNDVSPLLVHDPVQARRKYLAWVADRAQKERVARPGSRRVMIRRAFAAGGKEPWEPSPNPAIQIDLQSLPSTCQSLTIIKSGTSPLQTGHSGPDRAGKMPVSLPTELQLAIVNDLATPPHLDAYQLLPHSTHTLAQISLVSRALRELTEPLLYHRPYITPDNLSAFSRSLTAGSTETQDHRKRLV